MPRLLVLMTVLALAATGCSGSEPAAATPCDGRDQPADGAPATLPLGLPMTQGTTVLDVTTQGKTTIAFAKTKGGRDDIVAVRDRVLADLEGVGYTVVGTDQEPGFEAEAELAGTHEGTVKVAPLCTGLLEIRYKIEQ